MSIDATCSTVPSVIIKRLNIHTSVIRRADEIIVSVQISRIESDPNEKPRTILHKKLKTSDPASRP